MHPCVDRRVGRVVGRVSNGCSTGLQRVNRRVFDGCSTGLSSWSVTLRFMVALGMPIFIHRCRGFSEMGRVGQFWFPQNFKHYVEKVENRAFLRGARTDSLEQRRSERCARGLDFQRATQYAASASCFFCGEVEVRLSGLLLSRSDVEWWQKQVKTSRSKWVARGKSWIHREHRDRLWYTFWRVG